MRASHWRSRFSASGRQRRSFYYVGLLNLGAALFLVARHREWFERPRWGVAVIAAGLLARGVGFASTVPRGAGFGGMPRTGFIRYDAAMNFPLDVRFKLLAIASQIAVTDASGVLLLYARQKAFKLKEAVTVFADEAQTRALFRIAADRILDVSARYRIEDTGGAEVAVLQRLGMKSFWRTHYEIHVGGRTAFTVREENPWIKVLDGLVSSIPILGIFSGYVFHPAYLVSPAPDGAPLLRIAKKPALLEGRFQIERLGPLDERAANAVLVSTLMMLLLERSRG
jgi:hypothetical protein